MINFLNKVKNSGRLYDNLFVLFLVISAFSLRFMRTGFGLPYLYLWDEPQTSSTALRMLKTGDYNPYFFNYGTLLIYLNLFVDKLYLLYRSVFFEGILLSEIKIDMDTGWHWSISHPVFYYCNRILTSVLGTCTVIVTFYIGKLIFNRYVGFVSAVFLAVLPIHIIHSSYVTTDIPVGFFFLVVSLFSIYFIETGKVRYYLISLFFTGLTIATKYNGGLIYLLPFLCLLWFSYKDRLWRRPVYWVLLFMIPVCVFIVVMPYSVLDFPAFIWDALWELYHYSVLGTTNCNSTPGFEHFCLQLDNFYKNLGFIASLLACVGFLGGLSKPLFRLILIVPACYILFMVNMKFAPHRNFILIYPFIAVSIGAAFLYIHLLFKFICKRFKYTRELLPLCLTVLIAFLFVANQGCQSVQMSWKILYSEDVRSRIINVLNRLPGINLVVVARELQFHSTDLAKLNIRYSVQSLESMAVFSKVDGAVYVVPQIIKGHEDNWAREVLLKQKCIDAFELNKNSCLYKTSEHSVTYLDFCSENPGISIYSKISPIQLNPTVISLDSCSVSSDEVKRTFKNVMNFETGAVTTPTYQLQSGEYSFQFTVRKQEAVTIKKKDISLGKYTFGLVLNRKNGIGDAAGVKVSIFDKMKLIVVDNRLLEDSFSKCSVPFSLPCSGTVSIKIESTSVYSDPNLYPEIELKNLRIMSELKM